MDRASEPPASFEFGRFRILPQRRGSELDWCGEPLCRLETRLGRQLESATFDKVMAINSMQIWRDAVGGLRQMRRVLKSGGTVAPGFTPIRGNRARV